jgi:hypothetical protein
MEQLLITAAKLKKYRPTAELPEERVGPFILEAQQLDVKPIINELLYYDLCKNFDDTENQTLLDGGEYTYQGNTYYFEGLGAVIAYFALARFVRANPLHIVSYGIVTKNTPQSTPAPQELITAEVNALKSAAHGYIHEVKLFLERHPEDYPLYRTGGEDIKHHRKSSFKFFKG